MSVNFRESFRRDIGDIGNSSDLATVNLKSVSQAITLQLGNTGDQRPIRGHSRRVILSLTPEIKRVVGRLGDAAPSGRKQHASPAKGDHDVVAVNTKWGW